MTIPKGGAALAAVFWWAVAAACAGDQPGPARETPAESSVTAAAPGGALAPARRVVVNGIDLTGVGYDLGSPTAPVVLVNFSDFGCPFCGSFARETYPALDQELVRTAKVFFKYMVRTALGAENAEFGPSLRRIYRHGSPAEA